MYLRRSFRNKDGNRHAYWALVWMPPAAGASKPEPSGRTSTTCLMTSPRSGSKYLEARMRFQPASGLGAFLGGVVVVPIPLLAEPDCPVRRCVHGRE